MGGIRTVDKMEGVRTVIKWVWVRTVAKWEVVQTVLNRIKIKPNQKSRVQTLAK